MKSNITITQIFPTIVYNEASSLSLFQNLDNIPTIFTTSQKIIPKSQIPPTLNSILPPDNNNFSILYAPPLLEYPSPYTKFTQSSVLEQTIYETTMSITKNFKSKVITTIMYPEDVTIKHESIYTIQNPDDTSLEPLNLTKQELLHYIKNEQFIFYKTKNTFYHIIGYVADYGKLKTIIIGYYDLSNPSNVNIDNFASVYYIKIKT